MSRVGNKGRMQVGIRAWGVRKDPALVEVVGWECGVEQSTICFELLYLRRGRVGV